MFISDGTPLYLQLKNSLKELILKELKEGDLLPTEPEIEDTYKVSRITVRKAVDELVKEKLVYKKQGRGTFVSDRKILYDAGSVTSLTQRLINQGYEVKTKSMKIELIKGDGIISDVLNCSSGEITKISRVRTVDNRAFAIMINYLKTQDVTKLKSKFSGESLYSFLKGEYGIVFSSADETIEAKSANKMEAKELDISANDAILYLTRLSYDNNNTPIEYSNVLIRADMYKHKIRLSNNSISNG